MFTSTDITPANLIKMKELDEIISEVSMIRGPGKSHLQPHKLCINANKNKYMDLFPQCYSILIDPGFKYANVCKT